MFGTQHGAIICVDRDAFPTVVGPKSPHLIPEIGGVIPRAVPTSQANPSV
jgi:hypothetical protein